MFKYIACFALLAVASAAPGLIAQTHSVAVPVAVARTAVVDTSASSAITHQSFTNLVRNVPVVHSVATPVVHSVATPVVHSVASPVVHSVASPVVHTVAAAPLVHSVPVVKTLSAAPVVHTHAVATPIVHSAAIATPVVHSAQLVHHASPIVHSAIPVVHSAPILKTVVSSPVTYALHH